MSLIIAIIMVLPVQYCIGNFWGIQFFVVITKPQKFNLWNRNTCIFIKLTFYKNLDPSKIFHHTIPWAYLKLMFPPPPPPKISCIPHRRSSSHEGRYQSLVERGKPLKLHPQKVNHPRPRDQKQKKVCAEYCIVCILPKTFCQRPFPRWKLTHEIFCMTYTSMRMRYVRSYNAIQIIIFQPIPIFIAKPGDEN